MTTVIKKMQENLTHIGWKVDCNAVGQLEATRPQTDQQLSLSYYRDWMDALTSNYYWYMSRGHQSLFEFAVSHQKALYNVTPPSRGTRNGNRGYLVELIRLASETIDLTEFLFGEDFELRELVAQALKE